MTPYRTTPPRERKPRELQIVPWRFAIALLLWPLALPVGVIVGAVLGACEGARAATVSYGGAIVEAWQKRWTKEDEER